MYRVEPQQRVLQNDGTKPTHSSGHTHDCANRFGIRLHVSEGDLLLGSKQVPGGVQKEGETNLGAVLNTSPEKKC